MPRNEMHFRISGSLKKTDKELDASILFTKWIFAKTEVPIYT